MISVTEWQKRLRATDLPLATKGVLLTLSTYADWTTGEHIHPGELLQDECHIPRTTAWRHITAAIDAGWIIQTCHGPTAPRKTWANEYRLAIPDHVSSTEHGQPTTFHLRNDHVPPVEHHLVSTPLHKATSSASGKNGHTKSNQSEKPIWDGNISSVTLPRRFDPGLREYFVSPDGTVRPSRGLQRSGEVRVPLDLEDIRHARVTQNGHDRAIRVPA